MASLRAAAVRARAINAFRRNISTRGDRSESDRNKRPSLPQSPPTLVDDARGWDEDLATPSEAFVKADREPTIKLDEMERKTIDYVRRQAHRERTALEVEQTHATYARDEVSGPLGSAGMGEFEGVVGADDLGPDEAQARVEPNGRVVSRCVAREESTVRGG